MQLQNHEHCKSLWYNLLFRINFINISSKVPSIFYTPKKFLNFSSIHPTVPNYPLGIYFEILSENSLATVASFDRKKSSNRTFSSLARHSLYTGATLGNQQFFLSKLHRGSVIWQTFFPVAAFIFFFCFSLVSSKSPRALGLSYNREYGECEITRLLGGHSFLRYDFRPTRRSVAFFTTETRSNGEQQIRFHGDQNEIFVLPLSWIPRPTSHGRRRNSFIKVFRPLFTVRQDNSPTLCRAACFPFLYAEIKFALNVILTSFHLLK